MLLPPASLKNKENECFKFEGACVDVCGQRLLGAYVSDFKIVMAGSLVSPLLLTGMRVFGAMVLFWVVSFFMKPEHVNHRDLARLFGASLLAIVFNQGCFIFGVSLTSPADASIITTSMPLWAMVLAAFFLKSPSRERKCLALCLVPAARCC